MATSTIQFSTAVPAQRVAIQQLLAAVQLPASDLPADLSNFVTATDGGRLVGVAGLELYGRHALLRSVAVDPAYRHQGIADQLITKVEEQAGSLHFSSMFLLTETAAAYFERKGYQPISRCEVPEALQHASQFRFVCSASAVTMKKNTGL